MRKIVVIVFSLFIVGLIGFQVYHMVSQKSGKAKDQGKAMAVAVAVETAQIQKTTIRDIQLFSGTLMPKAHFIVAPKIGGRIEKLLVNIGDTIKRNQLIAVLDDDEYAQQVEQSRAELHVAKANLEEQQSAMEASRREFERIEALHLKKVASDSELDSIQANQQAQSAKVKVAMAQVSQKEAALRAAEVRLSYTKIQATWPDGNELRVVGERFADEGAMLSANAPIVSVYDINSLTAVVFIIERDYPKVQAGQEAIITLDAYPERIFTGKIVRISPVLQDSSRQARVEIDIPNPDWLIKPGMFARVHIEFARHDEATVVPIASLVKRNDQQGVFLADAMNMKAQFVPVDLGIVNKNEAEVVNPLLSGLVVILGQHLLEDGSAIILHSSQNETNEAKDGKDDLSTPAQSSSHGEK